MNCRHVERLLSDCMEGLLPERQADRVAEHLRACSACRRLLDELLAAGAALRAPLELPSLPGMERRIAERWIADRAALSSHSRRRLTTRFPLRTPAHRLAAAGLAILLAAALGLTGALFERDNGSAPRGEGDITTPGQQVANSLVPAATRNSPPTANRAAPAQTQRLVRASTEAGAGPHPRPLPQKLGEGRLRPAPSLVPPPPAFGGGGQGVGAGLDPPIGRPDPQDELAVLNGAHSSDEARGPALPPVSGKRWEDPLRRRLPAPDDFIQAALPRLADVTGRQIAAAADSYQRQAALIDTRLARPVTLAVKATALSGLCDPLRKETGIKLTAGPSIADEKVTVFCQRAPLRDVMRQLSGPFGYTWLRSGQTSVVRRQASGERPTGSHDSRLTSNDSFRYELEQDLRSQLLEEELRHRDRDAALLALDRDVERCRTYLDLSPDEALAQAKKAPAADKKLLEQLATTGWGAAQMYFRLSPDEMAELRAGRALVFGSNVTPDPLGRPRFDGRRTADALDFVLRPLPPEIARGTLQSLRDWRVNETNGVAQFGPAQDVPNGVPVTSWSGARPAVILLLRQDEQGQYTLYASAGLAFGPDETRYKLYGGDPLAVGLSPSVARPDNRVANAGLAHDPALQRVVTVEPQASCGGFRSPALASLLRRVPNPPQSGAEASDMTPRKVTTADVLEALHRATGMNLAADYYTRLYPAASVTLRSVKLFDALNQLADTMRMRWSKEGNWVRFRTIAFYNDRLKEVPNRLLERWAASRKQHGALTLDDLIEIAQLSDAQLDSRETGEGAWLCSGLEEWFLASHPLRYHLRFLGGLSPAQRRQAQTDAGLPFTQMSLPQQQQFLALAVEKDDLQKLRLADLAGPRLQVRYTPSGEFQWRRPPAPNNPPLPSLVHERTREAALAAARRIDPRADVTQIAPADMNLVFLYTMSEAQNRRVAFR